MQLPWNIRRIFKFLMIRMPDGQFGTKCRKWYYEKMQNVIFEGQKYSFRRGFDIKFSENVYIKFGNEVTTNYNVTIDLFRSDGLIIGNNVSFGPDVYVRTSNHVFEDSSVLIQKQGHTVKKKIEKAGRIVNIVIGNDVLISARVIILSGAIIGDGCVIGAGAVVTGKEYPPMSIIAGNPARVIGKRDKS